MKVIVKQSVLLMFILLSSLCLMIHPLTALGESVDSGETEAGIGFNTKTVETAVEDSSSTQLPSSNIPKKYNGLNYFPKTNERLNVAFILSGLVLVLWVMILAAHKEEEGQAL
ncbi:hypothetical protein ACYSNR_17995 [Enterococcus sp. LJL128]|uniref:hypothetical protein n=1 Tax=Enterococcus sp. LJL51 TaxID=3416656 RepID=UPI003CF8EF4B